MKAEGRRQKAEGGFRCIVIDPPWPGPGNTPHFGNNVKGAIIPYATLTGIQCAALRVAEIAADDAQVWIWSPSRNIGDAMLLLGVWRFAFRALLVWKKALGLGRHVQHEVEFLVWGARKGARLRDPKKSLRQMHEWPKPKRHSEKPAEAYEMIASLSDEPRIDIFARQYRPGFEAFGNELPTLPPSAPSAPSCLPRGRAAALRGSKSKSK